MKYAFLVFKKLIIVSILVIILALILQIFVKPYFVDGLSMFPTLNDGDLVIFLKTNFKGKYFYLPQSDDIVLIKTLNSRDNLPKDKYIIKRIMAMPLDFLEREDDKLFVNGKLILKNAFRENENYYLENGKILKLKGDEYFVVGDNLPYSIDSRFFGPIKLDEIIGKAIIRIWPSLKSF